VGPENLISKIRMTPLYPPIQISAPELGFGRPHIAGTPEWCIAEENKNLPWKRLILSHTSK
jgi:hypothetical protein